MTEIVFLINSCPHFTLGDGVWGFLNFWSSALGAFEYTAKKPVPIFFVKSDIDVSFPGKYS